MPKIWNSMGDDRQTSGLRDGGNFEGPKVLVGPKNDTMFVPVYSFYVLLSCVDIIKFNKHTELSVEEKQQPVLSKTWILSKRHEKEHLSHTKNHNENGYCQPTTDLNSKSPVRELSTYISYQ